MEKPLALGAGEDAVNKQTISPQAFTYGLKS